jgi:predicted dinucleotide-binding enzyme
MDGTVRIGILGTGVVGQTIGGKLADLGHDVKLGSRTATNEKAAKWVAQHGSHASQGTFADAASFGEIVFNCTSGMVSLEALHKAARAITLAARTRASPIASTYRKHIACRREAGGKHIRWCERT